MNGDSDLSLINVAFGNLIKRIDVPSAVESVCLLDPIRPGLNLNLAHSLSFISSFWLIQFCPWLCWS